MMNNIEDDDISKMVNFIKKKTKLTASKQTYNFEKKWSKWLGCKYSVFVNSGSSANFLTIRTLKIFLKNKNKNEIIVPPLAWNSDIVSVLMNSYKPIFVDINLRNLAMNIEEIKKKITKKTAAIFLSHIQGFNGLSAELLKIIKKKKIILIEDVCESHGAKFNNIKCGNFGLASNFSFYYAHHMTTIEGGMISTNNKKFYDICCMLRGHGLVRESKFKETRNRYLKKHKDLNSEFIFSDIGFNFRNNEIGAVLGLNQIKKLSKNISLRNRNMSLFIRLLNKNKFFTDFDLKGSSNYAFPVILKEKNFKKRDIFEKILKKNKIEFRRGNAGGGNQLRQPYLKKFLFNKKNFQNVEHIHHFGYYIGNYPSLKLSKIIKLVNILNSI
ncbi:MAG: DegT/DnrJ/EryC1/StrS aminotransferase family protein [Pelagibacterales bacterium]|nr:DegT/DnrJ/EryC1/StrS aminotransferase family protein [Pelagibacterales bacterium]